MGSPDVRGGGSIWPPFSSSQQGQSKSSSSIREGRFQSDGSSQMAAKRKRFSEVLANSVAARVGLEVSTALALTALTMCTFACVLLTVF